MTAAVALLGAALIGGFSYLGSNFLADPAQLAGALLLAVTVILVALRFRATPETPSSSAWPALAVGLVAATAFQLWHRLLLGLPAGIHVAGQLAIVVIAVFVIRHWRLAPVGLAGGAVLTYAWVGLQMAVPVGAAAVAEQIVVVLIALAILGWALKRRDPAVPDGASAAAPGRSAAAAGG